MGSEMCIRDSVEEVIGMIIYLLSPLAKKITGQMLVIDGHTETLSMMEKD